MDMLRRLINCRIIIILLLIKVKKVKADIALHENPISELYGTSLAIPIKIHSLTVVCFNFYNKLQRIQSCSLFTTVTFL